MGIALGLIGMIVLHVGIGVQKMGVAVLAEPPETRSHSRRWGMGVLAGGYLITGVGMLTNFVAMRFGLAASTLALFTGVGLIALVLFARRFLTEDVGVAEAGAIVLILAGTTVGGIPAEPGEPIERSLLVLGVATGVVLLSALLAELAMARGPRELLQGVAAGVAGGLGLNVQKELAGAPFDPSAIAPGALLTVIGVGSALSLNLAFRRHRAVLLVPLGAACSVLTGVTAGVLVQGEGLGVPRAAGVALTLVGVLLVIRAGLVADRG